jgi:(4S)-4-hydroxy-5-phosphonooxypentane-2,3-dione isomerase
MISLQGRIPAPTRRFVLRAPLALAFVFTALPHGTAFAQAGGEAIYGVTALDVVPSAANEGVALLKQYREGGLKQPGNLGVTLLQEAGRPNRFIIYDGWKDQAAYEANDKTAHAAQLRDKLKGTSNNDEFFVGSIAGSARR